MELVRRLWNGQQTTPPELKAWIQGEAAAPRSYFDVREGARFIPDEALECDSLVRRAERGQGERP